MSLENNGTTNTEMNDNPNNIENNNTGIENKPEEANKTNANGSILGNEEEAKKEVAPIYPEDWREKYAKEDNKKLEILKRYTSPEAALDALFEARKKIQEGSKGVKLPKDATPEQVELWRKENDIPESPDKYNLSLKDGYVIGEEDKPILDKVLETLHKSNIPNSVASEIVNSYNEARKLEEEQEIDRIIEAREQARVELQETWGKEYKNKVTTIENFIEKRFGQEEAAMLFGARLPDGSILGSNTKVLSKLYELASETDPEITLLNTLNNRGTMESINERISEIEKIMRTNESEYYRNQSLQDEYGKLLMGRENLSRRKY